MKNSWWMILSAVVILFNACAGPTKRSTSQNRFGSGAATRGQGSTAEQDARFIGAQTTAAPSPTPMVQGGQQTTPTSSPTVSSSPPVTTTSTSAPQEMPYATPVAGKPGLVTSPFAPYAGYVDVRGYPPGQEVKCPYTGKLFRVP